MSLNQAHRIKWQEYISSGKKPRTITSNNIPIFTALKSEILASNTQKKCIENQWKDFFKRWPSLYEFLVDLIGPSLFTGITAKKFVKSLPSNFVILHGGSGTSVIGKNVLNVDLFPFPGVHVVADLTELPFRDASFHAVTCDQVLEHVQQPLLVAKELYRVTKPGGLIHIACPFMFPWHPSPSDFSRWTHEGLISLFPECKVIEQGITAGPFSAFTAFCASFLATIFSFGSYRIQGILQYIFFILFAPIKCFDFFFAHFPNAALCAANLYIILKVPYDSTKN